MAACLLLSAICLLFVFTRDGSLSLWESAAILAVFVFYMAESLLAGRREQGAEQPAETKTRRWRAACSGSMTSCCLRFSSATTL